MVRTIPSLRIALAREKDDWKPFLNALDRSARRRLFDEMSDIPSFTSLSLLSYMLSSL